MIVRHADSQDYAAVLDILEPVIRAGETYTLPADMTRQAILDYWFSADKRSYVAVDPEAARILGTYYIRPNQLGGGDHVCNCGYVTDAAARGQGVARQMGIHSFTEAARLGYRAMQFNAVVATNAASLHLWQSLGFTIIGTVPDGFHHPTQGYVDSHILYRALVEPDGISGARV